MQIKTVESIITIGNGYTLSESALGLRIHTQGQTFRVSEEEYKRLIHTGEVMLGKQPLSEFIEQCYVGADSQFAKDLEKIATKQPLLDDRELNLQVSLQQLQEKENELKKKSRKSNKK